MTPLLTPLLIPFPDIDPVLFSFTLFGLSLSIHWYAVAYICGFIIGWRWLLFLTRKPHLWYKKHPPLEGQGYRRPDDLVHYRHDFGRPFGLCFVL